MRGTFKTEYWLLVIVAAAIAVGAIFAVTGVFRDGNPTPVSTTTSECFVATFGTGITGVEADCGR